MALSEYDLEQTNGHLRIDIYVVHSLDTELFLIPIILLNTFLGTMLDLAEFRLMNQNE